jgi:hypothetical protein
MNATRRRPYPGAAARQPLGVRWVFTTAVTWVLLLEWVSGVAIAAQTIALDWQPDEPLHRVATDGFAHSLALILVVPLPVELAVAGAVALALRGARPRHVPTITLTAACLVGIANSSLWLFGVVAWMMYQSWILPV